MEALRIFVTMHRIPLLFAFGASFASGFSLAMCALGINREGRKRGFRRGRFTGYDKKLDKQLLREYEDDLGISSLLEDDQEHHASRKFVS